MEEFLQVGKLVKDDFVHEDSDAAVVVPESSSPDIPVRMMIVGEKVFRFASECHGGIFTIEWESSCPLCKIGIDRECRSEGSDVIAGVA